MASDTIHNNKSVSSTLLGNKANNNIRKFFNRFPHKSPPLSPHNDQYSDMNQCPVLSSSSSLSNENDLSPTQIQIDLVRTSWERVSQIRHSNDDRNISASHAFGLAFYDALFEMDNQVKELFDNVFQQARALTGMISYIARAPGVTTASRPACCTPTMPTTIRDINASKKNNNQEYEEGDPEWLAAQMRELGARHYFYKVKPHHLELVGPAFVTALKKRLGEEYTDDIGDAWVKVPLHDHLFISSLTFNRQIPMSLII
jgi:hemoglobin-like flavoprotein